MLRVGITGGIASGKSVVAEALRHLGFPAIDADSLGHELMEPGTPAYADILREFGAGITEGSGPIDRAKLGAAVFADPAKRMALNAILHPRIAAEMERRFAAWARDGVIVAFVEAALLVEAGYQKYLDGLIVVWCRPEQQLDRLRARGLSEEEARRRIAAQMPAQEKLRYATETLDCSGTLEETQRQVAALAARLRQKAGQK